MHSFGHTDIYLGEAFIVLQGNFNDFRYNITRLLGTAQRAGNDDFDVFVFEVVGGGVSLVNTLLGIARKLDTDYKELAQKNDITNPNLIYPGEVLKI